MSYLFIISLSVYLPQSLLWSSKFDDGTMLWSIVQFSSKFLWSPHYNSHTLFLRIQKDFLTMLITILNRCGPSLLMNLQLFNSVCPPVTWYKWTVPQFPRPKLSIYRHIHKKHNIVFVLSRSRDTSTASYLYSAIYSFLFQFTVCCLYYKIIQLLLTSSFSSSRHLYPSPLSFLQ